MQIQCDCGQFKVQIENFPSNTPGRCVCYCDDCQTYLNYLKRSDLLDEAGGTELIPVYPKDLHMISGGDLLRCTRLSPKGLFRYWTSCCRTPITNTMPGFPWAGMIRRVFQGGDPQAFEKNVGPVKSRIFGKFAHGKPPAGTSEKPGFKDLLVIAPFFLKGFLFGKSRNSPLFKEDGKTPICVPEILTLEQREASSSVRRQR